MATMRDPVVALYVGSALVLAWRLGAAWRARHAGGLLPVALQVLTVALAALLFPIVSWYAPARGPRWFAVVAALAATAAWRCAPARWWAAMDISMRARPRLATAGLVGFWSVAVAGGLEIAASSAVRARLAQRYTPTETVLAQQTEDWRLSHIMSDDYREPDPVLLWQPVARPPYSRQRFRGPEVAVEKPAGTLRVICFGDSNTDGPLEGGAWPEGLGALLAGDAAHPVEVMNAGVTGYSSHQGAARVAREVPVYRPDVVLLSFGWNDAASAIGGDDAAFATAARLRDVSPTRVALRRALFRYDAVLVAARLMARPSAVPAAGVATAAPRVSVDDYARNLRAMARTAGEIGARVVILTRPHRDAPAALASMDGWRRHVPEYNARARRMAAELGVTLVDAQRHFEGHGEAFADEAHLTRAGHDELARLVRDTLRREGVLP